MLLDEAIEYLQDKNNEVLFVTCSGEIKPCDLNYEQSSIRCKECMFSSRLLLNKVKQPGFNHAELSSFINQHTEDKIRQIKFDFDSIDDVKNIHYNGANIGLGVVSSYVSMTRNLEPHFNKTTREFLNDALRASAILAQITDNMIDTFKPDVLCMFNGRFSGLRPVMEVSLKKQIKTEILECTFSSNREEQHKVKFINTLPHNIDNNTILIDENWNSRDAEKERLASEFFEKRRKGEVASDAVHISGQKHDLIPSNWDDSKRNFVIFNSSEDEFFCIGESFDKYKLFENQVKGIHYLIEKTASDPTIHYYLRVHPNLKNIKFNYHSGLTAIFESYSNITVIPSDSPVSTYKLIDKCEKAIVFGSTAGVEANYWGKPVLLLAGSFYLHLNVAYYPKNLRELDALLVARLEPKPRLGSLKFALFIFGKRGMSYKHINFNFKIFKIGNRQLQIARCFEYKGSAIPYLFLAFFFRLLNIVSHLIFKKVTIKKMMVEKETPLINKQQFYLHGSRE